MHSIKSLDDWSRSVSVVMLVFIIHRSKGYGYRPCRRSICLSCWCFSICLLFLFYTCLSMDFLLITLLGNIEYLYRVFIVSNFILCIWKSFLLVAYLSLLSYISIWGLTCQYWCWSHLYLWAPISQDWHTIRCDIGLKLST